VPFEERSRFARVAFKSVEIEESEFKNGAAGIPWLS
jgi:hypothetical protein